MKIIQYVYWTEPNEREKLNNLMKKCESEMELRKEIAKEFNISNADAYVVFKQFKDKFITIKNQKLC